MPELVQLGGSGNPVLLLHGFGADRQTFLGNVAPLTKIAEVWALDLAAHGVAATKVPALGLAGLYAQLRESITSLPELPLHIVGHSVGGALAMLLAAEDPRTVGLSLVAPMGLGKGVSHAFMNEFPKLADTDSVVTQLHRLVYDERLISPLVAPVVLEHLTRPGVRRSLSMLGDSLIADSYNELNQAIEQIIKKDIPRQVFWGREDVINPYEEQDKSRFGGQWQLIGHCGHLPHIEHRIRFNRALVAMIEDLADNKSGEQACF